MKRPPPQSADRKVGRIFKVFNSRIAGYIMGEDHRRYLFFMSETVGEWNATPACPLVGDDVTFVGYDDGMGDRAVEVKFKERPSGHQV